MRAVGGGFHAPSCADDHAIRPRVQEKFIALVDAFAPKNPTEVRALNTSHSSFISQPEELAKVLIFSAAVRDRYPSGSACIVDPLYSSGG
jgi:hypothetical protein